MAVAAAVGSSGLRVGRRSTGRGMGDGCVVVAVFTFCRSANVAPNVRFRLKLQFPRSAREWQIVKLGCQSAER
jgi:hypothetical protein